MRYLGGVITAKKYYWLRLKDDWFKSKVIKKLRKIAGGDTYTIIYLKMQLLSLKNEGRLYYDGVEESFSEELALELDEDPENVKVTISFLQNCGLIEILDVDEYMLIEVPKSIGSESESAERVRRCRANKNKKLLEEKTLHCNDEVTICSTEIDIDIEKREDIEKDSCPVPEESEPETEIPFIMLPLNTGEEYPVYPKMINLFSELYPAVDVPQAMRDMKGWLLMNTKKRKTKRGIGRFINSWLAREQDKGGTVGFNAQTAMAMGKGKHKQNLFNNFPQRQYDYNQLEKDLLKADLSD